VSHRNISILVDNPARCYEILKYLFHMNSHADKLFGKQKMVD
jgi:hypothetical protein